MKSFLLRKATTFLQRNGHHVIHQSQYRPDLPKEFWDIWDQVKPFTLTSPERGFGLYQALLYLEENQITGDVVECGVYQGGSSFLAARTLLANNLSQQNQQEQNQQEQRSERHLWLYDTFEGMPEPGDEDRIAFSGQSVRDRWKPGWWEASAEQVALRMGETGYPEDRVHIIQGDVIQTLKTRKPGKIALLRLDTDWYASTKAELENLYPLLVKGGILIIDDYGHFTGARQAVDEYFMGKQKPLLNRLDYTGRLLIKAE